MQKGSTQTRIGARGCVPAARWIAFGCCIALCCLPAFAETNQATGDLAGDALALLDSNVVTLNSTGSQLALVKRAYLSDGTRVPTTSSLPSGSAVDFLIYVSNDSTVTITDVSLQDVLDPGFTYQTGSIRVDNSVINCAAAVCTPAEEDNLYSVVEPTAPLSDAVDSNVVSHVSGTIDAGNASQANAQLDIVGQRIWAMVFTVTVP